MCSLIIRVDQSCSGARVLVQGQATGIARSLHPNTTWCLGHAVGRARGYAQAQTYGDVNVFCCCRLMVRMLDLQVKAFSFRRRTEERLEPRLPGPAHLPEREPIEIGISLTHRTC